MPSRLRMLTCSQPSSSEPEQEESGQEEAMDQMMHMLEQRAGPVVAPLESSPIPSSPVVAPPVVPIAPAAPIAPITSRQLSGSLGQLIPAEQR